MLTKNQLKSLHSEDLPLHILEEDYVQTVLLKGIFSQTDFLVFKGGTCLRKVYGLNRFSEDLDFTIWKGEAAQVKEALEGGIENASRTGIKASLKNWEERKSVFLVGISYHGPLYTGQDISKGKVEIEVFKGKILREPEWKTILSEYPDTGTFSVQSMALEEILAEKLRSLRQRKKPRDLYDIWFLTRKGVTPSLEEVNAKLGEVREEKTDKIKSLIEGYEVTEEEWKRDLGTLMSRVPEMSKIRSEVLESLAN